jgi:hypothetical protein
MPNPDLALSRITHDLVWQIATPVPVVAPAPPQVTKYAIWPIEGADKVAQQIKINLLSFLGEWFLDNTYGVPYLEDILVKNPRMAVVETILRFHIMDIPNVLAIDSLVVNWDRKARVLGVQFTCETDLGPITQSINLEIMPRV